MEPSKTKNKKNTYVAKWVTKDQIELRETNYSHGKPILETDYVFKRKETNQAD